jgi:hypothetical protein
VVRHLAHVSAARFTVCPSARGTVCKVGNLPVGQADELLASVKVGHSATVGKKVTLTATASGKSASSFHAAASVVIATAPQVSPSPSSSIPPLPSLPAPTLPGSVLGLSGTGIGPGNPGNLFPTVTPGASASPTSPATGSGRNPHRVNAVPASATLPLDPRLIGGQLAGLAVLAGAIAIAIARLSLRTQRPQGSKPADD